VISCADRLYADTSLLSEWCICCVSLFHTFGKVEIVITGGSVLMYVKVEFLPMQFCITAQL